MKQQTSSTTRKESEKAKLPWRKPAITFVNLNLTAGNTGSDTDGFGGNEPTK